MCSFKMPCLALFIVFATCVQAQNTNTNILDSFSAKFITTIRANQNQRAYLVTDKSVFRAGEDIWFKAFVFNSVSQKLSNKSGFLFADIVNDKDSIIKRLILDATNKQVSAHIQLPDSLATGYYWLRAYTKQMATYDTNNICVKPLYIFGKTNDNILAKQKRKTAGQDDIPSTNFYPEGGSIMTGINSAVAVQTIFKNGIPAALDVYVKDNRDTVVAKFTTNKNGLGKFDFEPSGYRQYKAVIKWNGKEINYPLPAFNFYAGQLSVTHQQGQYKLRVLLGDSIYTKSALSYVMGISKDSLVFAGIGEGLYEVTVDEQKLPQGITTFYLFNKDLKLLSERSVYINNNNLQVTLAADKNIYNKEDKVTLSLSITDASQHAVPALLAVAVSDSMFSDKEERTCNEFFDLQEADNLFLAGNNCFTSDETDLVMLTKTNTYQNLTKNKKENIAVRDDSLLYIKGTVTTEKNVPLADKIVMLLSNSSGNDLFYSDTTDDEGHFLFPFDKYPDSIQFAIQVKDLNNNRIVNSKIIMDPIAYPKFTTPVSLKRYLEVEPKTLQRLNAYYSGQFNGEKLLPPVTVKKLVDYDESKRVSSYSSIITSRDLDGRTGVDNAIFKLSGLQLINGYLIVRGLNSTRGPDAGAEPLVLVDGVPAALSAASVSSTSPVMSFLSSLNPKDIDFIELLKDAAASNFGLRGENGVILINLTNKIRDLGSNASNMKIFYLKGVSKSALFPNLMYNHKDKKATLADDARSTLFWSANLLTGDAANSTLGFYTSDVPSTYNITVTGITAYGDIIRKTISVQSK